MYHWSSSRDLSAAVEFETIGRYLSRRTLFAILVLGVTVIAAGLRLYRINELPPGLYRDEAHNGLDALAVARGERHPLYFEGNNGREPLYIYLQAGLLTFLPPTPLTLRLASVIIGSLTPLTVYFAARSSFSGAENTAQENDRARWIGLIAALTTATLFWMVDLGRVAFRAISLPPLSALAWAFLWKGIHEHKRWAFGWAGGLVGLCLYTYLAANLLPLLMILVVLYCAWTQPRFWRTHWKNLIVFAVVGLVVFAPLGCTFLLHPHLAARRASQVVLLPFGDNASSSRQAIKANLLKWALAFSWQGDPLDRHNLSGRPALDGFQSLWFWIGCIVALFSLKKPQYGSLFLWLGVMLLPSIFTPEAPHFLRAIGSAPPMAILVAVGSVWAWSRITSWGAARRPVWRSAAQIVCALVGLGGFVWSGWATGRDYFVRWANNPGLFTHFDAGPLAIGQYIATTAPHEAVYVSPVPIDIASIPFASGGKEPVKSFNGRRCLVLRDHAQYDTHYVIVHHQDTQSLDALARFYPQGRTVAQGPLHYGQPYFLVYRVPSGAVPQIAPQHALQIDWQARFRLLGFDVDASTYAPGGQIELVFYWKALAEMSRPYTVFVHLLGDTNPATGSPLWAGFDKQPGGDSYPTIYWTPGEIIVDRHTLPLPADIPGGDYQLEIGLYYWATGERLTFRDETGRVQDHLILGDVTVRPAD